MPPKCITDIEADVQFVNVTKKVRMRARERERERERTRVRN